MNCSNGLYDALEYRLIQLAKKDDSAVQVDSEGISICTKKAQYIIYRVSHENGDSHYLWIMGCKVNLSDEQYTKLKLIALDYAKKTEERLIKHLYDDESTSN